MNTPTTLIPFSDGWNDGYYGRPCLYPDTIEYMNGYKEGVKARDQKR